MGALVPAEAVVALGGSATFALPATVSLDGRRIQWSTNPSTIASIPSSAPPRGAIATAKLLGRASVTAVDLNSPATCPLAWTGTLVVQ
jgi:hypothetical protein